MPTTVRRLGGQASGGPSGVVDQSCARINRPNAPPPVEVSTALGDAGCLIGITAPVRAGAGAPFTVAQGLPSGRCDEDAYLAPASSVMACSFIAAPHA